MTSHAPALSHSPSQYRTEPQTSKPIPMASPSRSEIVTSQNFTNLQPNLQEHAALKSGLLPRLRMLRAVVERLPRHFTPYKTEPSYKLTFYIEKLSCGHERIYYPQAGPMSRRRHCSECAALALPPKKPVTNAGPADYCDAKVGQ